MANKEKKRKRNNPHHDYVVVKEFIHRDTNNSIPRWYFKGDIVYEFVYEKLSNNHKKLCKALPPKEVMIKEKVKKEKAENNIKIESKGFDTVTSFRKPKEK